MIKYLGKTFVILSAKGDYMIMNMHLVGKQGDFFQVLKTKNHMICNALKGRNILYVTHLENMIHILCCINIDKCILYLDVCTSYFDLNISFCVPLKQKRGEMFFILILYSSNLFFLHLFQNFKGSFQFENSSKICS